MEHLVKEIVIFVASSMGKTELGCFKDPVTYLSILHWEFEMLTFTVWYRGFEIERDGNGTAHR